MEKPQVSVIINTYNHKDYISQAIESVLMQKTTFAFEIIIGEDDSNDGTREICIAYAEKHKNTIRLFLRSRKDVIYVNGRPTGRRNFIENLKSSKGTYVALLPGDDFWTDPFKLQKQVSFLFENTDYSICFHNAKVIGNKKAKHIDLYSDFPWNKIDLSREVYGVKDLLESPLMPTCSVVFKNDFDFNFPQWFYKVSSADMAFFLLKVHGKKVKFLNEVMACYRKHDRGITKDHKHDSIHMNRIFMYKKLRKDSYKHHFETITNLIHYHQSQIKNPVNRLRAIFI